MKKILVAALALTQLATPAAAAELIRDTGAQERRMGAFAGARFRVSLDREASERLRAGLTLSPTMHDLRSDGSSRLRIGEGLEFGTSEGRAPALSFAGRPVRQIVQGSRAPDGDRRNISTVGWVAIGVGVAVAAGALWFFDAMEDASE